MTAAAVALVVPAFAPAGGGTGACAEETAGAETGMLGARIVPDFGAAGGDASDGDGTRAAFAWALLAGAVVALLLSMGGEGLGDMARGTGALFKGRVVAPTRVAAAGLVPPGLIEALFVRSPATGADSERSNHQPPTPATAIASRSHGSGLRRRRRAV